MHPAVLRHRQDIGSLCQEFGVRRLEVFGSAAREADFDPVRSDADLLVDFKAETGHGRFQDLKRALEQLRCRPVDLVERAAVEQSRNAIRRAAILSEARVLYAA